MILVLILNICILYLILYQLYNNYIDYKGIELHGKNIHSISQFKDFLIYLFNNIKKWIMCNILSVFIEKYKDSCFTGAVVLTQEDEIELDSAEPGSLGAALWELRADQERQTEDYLRANQDLNELDTAIVDRDGYAIFELSDEVEMDEEALYWRAWITAQASQMTHNLVNMEICDANYNLIDYMDLAATGLDKNGNKIDDNRSPPNPEGRKMGKDFRWSNRCMNTSALDMGFIFSCGARWDEGGVTERSSDNPRLNEQNWDEGGLTNLRSVNPRESMGQWVGFDINKDWVVEKVGESMRDDDDSSHNAVSYTHLTLPTKRIV